MQGLKKIAQKLKKKKEEEERRRKKKKKEKEEKERRRKKMECDLKKGTCLCQRIRSQR